MPSRGLPHLPALLPWLHFPKLKLNFDLHPRQVYLFHQQTELVPPRDNVPILHLFSIKKLYRIVF